MLSTCEVERELYVASPQQRVATSVSMTYIGQGLRLQETQAQVSSSDWSSHVRTRGSEDNGKSWSDWELVYEEAPTQGDFTQSGGPGPGGTGPLDPASGCLIKPVFQRIVKGDPRVAMSELWKGNRLFCDHGFYQLSNDDGRTWSDGRQLNYEDGPDFDPNGWGAPNFFRANEMYIGGATALANGGVVISSTVPVPYRDEEDEKVPSVFPNDYREGCVAGAVCFVGSWNSGRQDYDWQISNTVFVPRKQSTRGLVELTISELVDGRLLLMMRGSNTGLDSLDCPPRKWFSVSEDGGLTWSPVSDIRYDNGEQLYSPASIFRVIRSTKTGKLFFVGNIPDGLPNGNSPRYPLQIVEIDEDGPSFKKDSLTVIDDRDPDRDSEHVQLSNFSLLENRETLDMELYLTRLGERGGGDDTWSADCYRYTLNF